MSVFYINIRLIFVRSKCDFYLLFQYVKEVTYNSNPSTMFGPSNRNIRLSLCNEIVSLCRGHIFRSSSERFEGF